MPPAARPDTVLKRAEELINVGQAPAALQALHDIFTSRRFKQTPLSSLEPIVIRFIDLCVDLKRGRTAKDGLVQYKNISQNSNPASIDLAINHFLKLANEKVTEAQEKAKAAAAGGKSAEGAEGEEGDATAAAAKEAEVDDLEESETPESMLLGSVSVEESKDRTDRVLVTPWLKFLWEAYRTALDILKNNARLEISYQQVASQALKFCLTHERKTEFRRLCELMRGHLQNVARFSQHAHAINLTDPDTLQRHLDTRFAQLNAAVELELWQEAFRSVEDVHNLLTMAKKAPRPAMMANYYEKLARIFLVSDNALFHAAAWNRYHTLARLSGKAEEEQTKIASYVLLSALAVPVISSSAPGTGNMNRVKTDFLQGDVEGKSRTGRLTTLLGLQRAPTRAGLLNEALTRNVLKKAQPEIRELYHMLEVEFHPLSICEKVQPIIAKISKDEGGMGRYVKALHSVILTRLFQQLSQVYDKVKVTKVMQLVSAFEAPYNYTPAQIEKFALNACKRGHLKLSIDHIEQAITFQDDVFEADVHPSAQPTATSGPVAIASAAETDSVRLQSTPSELVRTQLARLATTLDSTLKIIDPSVVENAVAAKKQAFAHAIAVAEQEHRAAVARKAILARRKELLEEKAAQRDRDEAVAKAERARLAAAADQKRIAEETLRREQDRIKKELEAVRIEEAKKMAQSLKERGGLKLDDEEIANLDTDKLVQMQVEQIEKEKRDLNERLRVIHRRIDHLERAYRREEIPLLEQDYETQKQRDKEYHETARTTLLLAAKQKHAQDIEVKKRLIKILPDYKIARAEMEEKRRDEINAKKERALKLIEKEKAKKKAAVIEQKKAEIARRKEEERLREEEEEQERQRAEEEAHREEQRKAEAAKRAEEEEKRREEREAERRRLDEVAEKQRQREREVEEKLAAKREEERKRLGSGTSTPSTGSAWRPTSRPDSSATPPRDAAPLGATRLPSAAAGASGGWRARETARVSGAATPITNGASTPPTAQSSEGSPAPTPSRAAGAPAEAKPGVYRPGAFATRKPGAGPSWRDREAARQQEQ